MQPIAVFCGGRSVEHEVSIQSTRHVLAALDPQRYQAFVVGIDSQGRWFYLADPQQLGRADYTTRIDSITDKQEVVFVPDNPGCRIVLTQTQHTLAQVELLFPMIHGQQGEDGCLQGYARLFNLACVGSDVLGSALCMDKEVCKRVLQQAGLPVTPFVALRKEQGPVSVAQAQELLARLGARVFVKPANMGSSVGVSCATDVSGLLQAIEQALLFDRKVLIEAAVVGRELECAVVGHAQPRASVIGEITPASGYYSYQAKYLQQDARLTVPAPLSAAQQQQLQQLSIAAFQALECCGMARVDAFLTPEGKFLINEINTLPGFTSISMYPKLWEYSGIGPRQLVTELIDIAVEQQRQRAQLQVRATKS